MQVASVHLNDTGDPFMIADIIIENGNLMTFAPKGATAQALAIAGGNGDDLVIGTCGGAMNSPTTVIFFVC